MINRFLILLIDKSIYVLLFSVLLYSCSPDPIQEIQNLEEENFSTFPNFKSEPIEDQYIVVFHEDQLSFRVDWDYYENSQAMMRKEVDAFFRKHRIDPEGLEHIFTTALTGFSARIKPETLPAIMADPKVNYLEQDRKGELGPFEIQRGRPVAEEEKESTQVIPWGVQRVGGAFPFRGRHSVFILDTGIDINHPDLNVDVRKGFDAYGGKRPNWNVQDEHGHGTHVAGTVGALDNGFGVVGVAAGVPVVPVKIFTGPRAAYTYSGLVAGIEYVGVRGIPGDVANLSFGGFDESRVLDDAVLNVSNKRRVWMVIAAGNSRLPASAFSPARVEGTFTITVSAFQNGDVFAPFSHFGHPVKFAAPGVNIRSTWLNGRYANSTGTSMAAPHVAGLRVLGSIGTDGFVLNYPLPDPAPIAFRRE
ncbi:S8 family serine peptidase [Cecembia lonarensis]|uniref:Extracellular serine proteinase n=1 Tax=Cecembia lonarensis (strain CCUG 58316 / KCTC 22772 / LW9) TaxID=1225176 RepID=K1LJF1_CECL9|nr:S8 family serine peptidase [Cecembia lonarensis]EKB50453.1 Extracellular serine proteinase precursor [Cecembia lonarensis LW9]